jgi:hypothetical protein
MQGDDKYMQYFVGWSGVKMPLRRPRSRCQECVNVDVNEQLARVQTGFWWLRIGSNGGRLWCIRWWTLGFLERCMVPPSQEGHLRHGLKYSNSFYAYVWKVVLPTRFKLHYITMWAPCLTHLIQIDLIIVISIWCMVKIKNIFTMQFLHPFTPSILFGPISPQHPVHEHTEYFCYTAIFKAQW